MSIDNCFKTFLDFPGLNFVTKDNETGESKTLFACFYRVQHIFRLTDVNGRFEKDGRRPITEKEFKDFLNFNRATLSSLPKNSVLMVTNPADEKITGGKKSIPCAWTEDDKTITLSEYKLAIGLNGRYDRIFIAIDDSKGD